jgi:hypothetical protein
MVSYPPLAAWIEENDCSTTVFDQCMTGQIAWKTTQIVCTPDATQAVEDQFKHLRCNHESHESFLGKTKQLEEYTSDMNQRLAEVFVRGITQSTSISTEAQSESDESQAERTKTYQSLIGVLLWIATITRPDVAYAVSMLARFVSQPQAKHLETALGVLTYLYHTRDRKLTLGSQGKRIIIPPDQPIPKGLVSITDSSWGDEKPAYGHVCYYNGSAISWVSRRIKTTPLSSCEAEYCGSTEAAISLVHNQGLVADIFGYAGANAPGLPMPIYCDNTAACQLSEDALSGKRMKHVMRRLTYLRELTESKQIVMRYIPGEHNPADIFTKPLAAARFDALRKLLLEPQQ